MILPRCADTAREREDPPLGTAPMTRRWLLIEHPGPWRPEALVGVGFPTALLDELQSAAYSAGGRILLIRRPGRPSDRQAGRSWAVVLGGRGSVWGQWRQPDDLRAAAVALRHHQTGPGPALDPEPVILVCTHGVHDTCCAVRGRPVAAALEDRWPEATWECSHVGGDRFAPNVLVLPDGVYYGNLDPATALQTVEAHLGGQLVIPYLRGIARHPPVAQAAVGAVHARWGPFGVDQVVVTAIEHRAVDRWEIDLRIPGQPAQRLTVRTSPRPRARLTCRAAQPTSAVDYAVTEMRALEELG